MEFKWMAGPTGLCVAQAAELAAGFDDVAEVGLGIRSGGVQQLWSVRICIGVFDLDEVRDDERTENTEEAEELGGKGGPHHG